MMRYFLYILLVLWLKTSWSQTQFEDITHSINYSDIETHSPWGSGVSAADFDNDGDIDLFLSASGKSPNLLLVNQGGLSFNEVRFEKKWNTAASLWIDYDGDHLMDLFIAGSCPYGTEECQTGSYWRLLRQFPENTFNDVTEEAGLENDFGLMRDYLGGLAAGDLNLDGYLDLVMTYWTGPTILFMNNGDGTFKNASELISAGSSGVFWQPLIYDLDSDGWSEIYLTIEFGNPNQLWKQSGDMHFKNMAASVGLDSQCDDMGIAFGDVENDGDLDIYIACRDFENKYNPLLLNEDNNYTENAEYAGVGQGGWAWGTTFLDANNDGFQDLAVTNGILPEDENDQSKFWLNNGDGTFTDVSQVVNFDDLLKASSLISFDFDRDGDLDMIQSIKPYDHGGKSFRFLKNRLEHYDKGNYLVVKPRMLGANHWAIGSKVVIRYGDQVQVRPITAGISYFGQEPAEAFFGLGNVDMVDQVEITWPGGAKTVRQNIAANNVTTITDEDALHPPYLRRINYAYEGTVNLYWKKSSKVETGFLIEVSQDSLFTDPYLLEAGSSQTTIQVGDLTPGQKYYFRLIAMRDEDRSIPGNIVSETAPSAILNPPSNLNGELVPGYTARLTWEDRSENEIGYEVERSLSEDFESSVTFDLGPNSTSFNSSNLQPGFEYYFRVRAKSQNWYSEYSEVISISTVYIMSQSAILPKTAIYPNPNSGVIHLPELNTPARIRIISLSGQVLKDFTTEAPIIYHDLNPGVYLLDLIISDTKRYRQQLIVK